MEKLFCRTCGNEIKEKDEKHCFFEEDIEMGIEPECIDCHLHNEAICRDFGF